LATYVILKDFRPGQDLIIQGQCDDDIYFILSGSVSVIVNGRNIATRKAGEHVGEMALIDTTARRSATVKTLEPTVAAKVTERGFARTANKYPELWRRIAVVVAQRLRERNKFLPVPRSESAIFIGSSSEGLPVAEAIHRYLSRFPFVPRLWSEGVFECSSTTIEDLMQITRETDFAVIVLTPDDVIKSRGRRKVSPRDNVTFELGLFMGALARNRTYIVTPKGLDIKIPTDLLGVTCLKYKKRRRASLARCLQPVLRELRRLIQKYGPI
jgi:predicted nucleotide-binding protein